MSGVCLVPVQALELSVERIDGEVRAQVAIITPHGRVDVAETELAEGAVYESTTTYPPPPEDRRRGWSQ